MPDTTNLTARHRWPTAAAADGVWEQQWARVPDPWRTGLCRLDTHPFTEVFVRNTVYLRSTKDYDFRPTCSTRAGEEMCWWLWTVWAEGTRKVDPAMLRWWSRAIDALAGSQARFAGRRQPSLADFAPQVVVREAVRQFIDRNGRTPSPGNLRNLASIADDVHLLVSVRGSSTPWWRHDVWDLAVDDRIPRRRHEPHGDRPLSLRGVGPDWLREGLRFWLSQALITDQCTWTTAAGRAGQLARYLGRFAQQHDLSTPMLVADPADLRPLFMELLSWLRSPAATTTGRPLAATGVNQVQSMIQSFYTYMVDNRTEAALTLADPRWEQLTVDHTRLWAPQYGSKRAGNTSPVTFIGLPDTQRMFAWLDVLSSPTDTMVTVEQPGGDIVTTAGLGDPAAARVWLIQAMTGRRASEVLMLDHNPLTRIPGLPADPGDDDAFVARLRYQQTKVDGVDPTILVEQSVVHLIEEQQRFVADHHPCETPAYLFLNPRGNYRGLRPRSYGSYVDALRRLDQVAALVDAGGVPLLFTKTHRLRHTRATELLNAGVPIHVVQRYLGHRSPEMTMRYAATLASTAEAEFLRYKKVGADGRDLDLAPRDLLDLAQLDRRADRILPNGLCLLPPTSSCDKGNACLPCGSFATDATHLGELTDQRHKTASLVDVRISQYRDRHGADMPADNVWLTGRTRELISLDAIIGALHKDQGDLPRRGLGAPTRRREDRGGQSEEHRQESDA